MTEQKKKDNYKPMYTGPSAALRMAYLGKTKSERKAALREFGWWCGRVPK